MVKLLLLLLVMNEKTNCCHSKRIFLLMFKKWERGGAALG
jgi:hypothetical protein